MTVTGVTDCAILAIPRHRLNFNCTSIALFGPSCPATVPAAPSWVASWVSSWVALAPVQAPTQGGLWAVQALVPEDSLSDLSLVACLFGCRIRGGLGDWRPGIERLQGL